MSTPIRFNTKASLLAALEARRAWAIDYDKFNTAKHKADEEAALKAWRASIRESLSACREFAAAMLKLSYAEAKAIDADTRRYGNSPQWKRPNGLSTPRCPSSVVRQLDAVIADITASSQARYKIREHGEYSTVYYMLTHDYKAKADICA